MRWSALVLVCGLAACYQKPEVVPQPEIHYVTLVTSDVAIVPLDTAEKGILGRTSCGLDNRPYVAMSLNLSPMGRQWVMFHERVHVEQVRNYPSGCFDFMKQYTINAAFALMIEAEAYCAVMLMQKQVKMEPSPDLETIVEFLTDTKRPGRYWTENEVRQALRPCS